ncbi:hypothetical protein C2845_PM09G12800 [Panicum miliaceum]|uniref:tRNA-uridine aminocarboxypropyltransferase n=1 Tax=Panicum miliaceum TaxID=4540 RepID=A0A3L6S239_PANMI|nr:hypothetical protein C2845_PM09G12800 [Panicum miliaceum]
MGLTAWMVGAPAAAWRSVVALGELVLPAMLGVQARSVIREEGRRSGAVAQLKAGGEEGYATTASREERWTARWGDEDIPCISLSTLSASVMHKLRPQPAWDRTCTAAAAAGLLWELNLRPELSTYEFEKQAEAVECSLDILLDALTTRRVRLGRSITRKQRHNRNI